MKLIPYVMFADSQCREAFDFYAKVLRGRILSVATYGDMPPMDGAPPMPEAMKAQVANIHLQADGAEMMGADNAAGMCGADEAAGTDNTTVNIDVAGIEEAERIFAELSVGGKVVAPIAETFWAQRWGMLVDRYGKPWMVNCMKPAA